jgi:CHAD domain-containing protein
MGDRRATHPLSAELPVGVAARAVIGSHLTVLARELQTARTGKVEGVHQLRVVTRRLRATLALFEQALPRRTAQALDRELAELGRAVGPVRDLDVLALAVARRGRKIEPALEPAVATIVRHIRDRRAAAHALLVSTLDAPRTRRTMARLAALAAHRGHDATPFGMVAAGLVRPLVRDLRRAGRKVDVDPSPSALHRLRIRAKQLRYALETVEGLGGEATRTLARRLADLQHVLGDQRDATNQRAWLVDEVPAFAGDAEALVALGAITEGLRRRARRLAGKGGRTWRRVGRPKRVTAVFAELERGSRHAIDTRAA